MGGPRSGPPMRSIFPALHDRHLTALLCGGVILLAAVAIFAISASDRDDEAAADEHKRAIIRVTGASPAN